jgi:hypothetical protein
MVREHGSLTKDEETNQAAWEAATGALVGGTKVCTALFIIDQNVHIGIKRVWGTGRTEKIWSSKTGQGIFDVMREGSCRTLHSYSRSAANANLWA